MANAGALSVLRSVSTQEAHCRALSLCRSHLWSRSEPDRSAHDSICRIERALFAIALGVDVADDPIVRVLQRDPAHAALAMR